MLPNPRAASHPEQQQAAPPWFPGLGGTASKPVSFAPPAAQLSDVRSNGFRRQIQREVGIEVVGGLGDRERNDRGLGCRDETAQRFQVCAIVRGDNALDDLGLIAFAGTLDERVQTVLR